LKEDNEVRKTIRKGGEQNLEEKDANERKGSTGGWSEREGGRDVVEEKKTMNNWEKDRRRNGGRGEKQRRRRSSFVLRMFRCFLRRRGMKPLLVFTEQLRDDNHIQTQLLIQFSSFCIVQNHK